jgi:hypothetical protein
MGIRRGKYIYNFDETGARVGCPKGEEILVPIDVKEHYTSSPENRRSVTVMEAISASGKEPPPPCIIAPGKLVMDNWLNDNQTGKELIATSPTGYTNEEIAVAWMKHFIQHTNSGPDKHWKILLMDGHKTHDYPEFVLLADANNIEIIYFPSHLTHILQPLDVAVFRPWKHYHNQAIMNALRSLDFEYTISSFFRDLRDIRENTFKASTIKNAFQESGMWPVSCDAALKKMRVYQKKQDDSDNNEEPQLPTTPRTFNDGATAIGNWDNRVSELLSSPSARQYESTVKGIKTTLIRAEIREVEYRQLRGQVDEQRKRTMKSRKGYSTGGPVDINNLKERQRVKEKRRKIMLFARPRRYYK